MKQDRATDAPIENEAASAGRRAGRAATGPSRPKPRTPSFGSGGPRRSRVRSAWVVVVIGSAVLGGVATFPFSGHAPSPFSTSADGGAAGAFGAAPTGPAASLSPSCSGAGGTARCPSVTEARVLPASGPAVDPTWWQVCSSCGPAARGGSTMAFDPAAGATILFGGQGTSSFLADTWSFRSGLWTHLTPATSPPARALAAMAYDPATGQLLLFGGEGATHLLSDTWVWSGTSWTQLSPATSPPTRSGAALAFDPATGQLLLFGGENGATYYGDTWSWTGSSWTQLSPATSPPVRTGAMLAFDAGTGALVLFGGSGGGGALGDTWTWNGATWAQRSPSTSPPARASGLLAYDEADGVLLLFGGDNNPASISGFFSDTWAFTGTTWTQLSPSAAPTARGSVAAAFDPETGVVLQFGGFYGTTPVADAWAYGTPLTAGPIAPANPTIYSGQSITVTAPNPAAWSEVAPAVSPSNRSFASVAFDPRAGAPLLFGGLGPAGDTADTWSWNGSAWAALAPATSPSSRAGAAFAYDPSTAQLVLFGGSDGATFLGDTWMWTGTNWQQLSPATSPPARANASLAFDPATGQLLLFGGANGVGLFSDTWSWNGATWQQLLPGTVPAARSSAVLTFDAADGYLLLFGGAGASGALGDSWRWTGGNWVALAPATSPSARSGAATAADAADGLVLVAGGSNGSVNFSDSWGYRNGTWIPLDGATAPPAGAGSSAVFDPATGASLLVSTNGTWSYRGNGGVAPISVQWYHAPSPGSCSTGDTAYPGATSYTFTTPGLSVNTYLCYVRTGSAATPPAAGSPTDLVTVLPLTETFNETGLPFGTYWSVELGGGTLSSPTASVTFSQPNGTYGFVVGSVPAEPGFLYAPTPSSGTVNVHGSAVWISVAFAHVPANALSFVEKRLPIGLAWGVTVGLSVENNTTVELGTSTNSKGAVTFQVPAGPVAFSVTAPAGYGVARVVGPGSPNQTSGTPVYTLRDTATWTILFGPLETVAFNESSLPNFRLYAGAPWSVALTPALAHGGPAPQTNGSNGTTIAFTLPAGAAFKFAITGPGPEYKVLPAKGALRVPTHALTKVVKFRLLTETIRFSELHLAARNTWTVTITSGTTPALAFPFNQTKAVGTGGIVFQLPLGNYTFSVRSTSPTQVPGPAGGSFSVVAAPSPAQVIVVSFGPRTGGVPLGSSLAFGSVTNVTSGSPPPGCVLGQECYSVVIAAASGGVTAANLTFAARTGSNASLSTSGWVFTVVSASDVALSATWSGSGLCSGSACSTPLSAGETIVLTTGGTASLVGDWLVASGLGGFSGTVATSAFPA